MSLILIILSVYLKDLSCVWNRNLQADRDFLGMKNLLTKSVALSEVSVETRKSLTRLVKCRLL